MAKILAFDRERHNVRLFTNVLQQRGHNVIGETDKNAFIRLVEEGDFDLVLAGDPEDDNIIALLRELVRISQERENQDRSRFKVVALSHWSSDYDVTRGWQCEVDGYYTKPYNPLEICDHIDNIVPSGDDELEDLLNWYK